MAKKPAKTAFPKMQQVTFRYVDSYTLGGASVQSQGFRLNSLFDFDYTGTGKQPFQYDQMIAVYNRYRVLNVGVKFHAHSTYSASASYPVLAVYTSNVSTPVSTYKLAAEQQFSDLKVLGNTNVPITQFSRKYNIASILGYRENVDEDLSAVYSASPAQVAYLWLIADAETMSSSFSVQVTMEVTFYALVYDLVSPGESLYKSIKPVEPISEEEIEETQLVVIKKKK